MAVKSVGAVETGMLTGTTLQLHHATLHPPSSAQVVWSTGGSGAGGPSNSCSDETAIVPLLSGISLGLSDVGSAMDRQCIIASRLGNNGYSSNTSSCTSQAAADPTQQGAYSSPYLRYASTADATDYYCNGATTLSSFRGSGDCGLLPYLSVGADGTPLLSPHHAASDPYLMSRGGLTGLPKLPGPLSTSAAASSSSAGKDLARGGGGVDSKESRVCGVCGDKALGYNFDAISCESCKAFFRRNAPKGLEHFKCAYDYMCKMDLSNRRFCKRCRLGKCFQIGMRREYILTDDERAVKRQKIIENRLKRGASVQQNAPTSSNGVASSSSSSVESASVSPPIPLVPSSSSCATPPEVVAVVTSPGLGLPATATTSTCSSTTPVSPPGGSAVCSASQVSSQTVALCAEDAAAIDELVTAYRESLKVQTDLSASIDECTSSFDQLTVNNSASSFSDLVNIAELSVRRVIAMAKQMRAFRAISHDDQIQLLKGGSIELLILRSVLTFDKDKLQFLDPLDPEETKAMKVEQLRHAEQGTGLFDDHMAFVRSLAFDMNVDETALILLLVIALFSPDRDRLTNRELVAAEQERYTVLLKRYLESILPASTARNIFPKLLHKLADVRDLNEKHSLVLLKVNPVGIQPLMKEVLDIDH